MSEHVICFKGTVINYMLDCYENNYIINGKLYFSYVNDYAGPDITLGFIGLYILAVKSRYIISNRVWQGTAYDFHKNVSWYLFHDTNVI